jgi:hypothetical protein
MIFCSIKWLKLNYFNELKINLNLNELNLIIRNYLFSNARYIETINKFKSNIIIYEKNESESFVLCSVHTWQKFINKIKNFYNIESILLKSLNND